MFQNKKSCDALALGIKSHQQLNLIRISLAGSFNHMADQLREEEALKQVANVATLPGILTAAMAMPDMHWGYGFPIGGVAAFDWDEGVISPGGVGYDINCGVRLAGTGLEEKEIRPVVDRLVEALFQNIPTGVGSTGSVKLSVKEELKVLKQGGAWAVHHGLGDAADVERTEDGGCMTGDQPMTHEQVRDQLREDQPEDAGGNGNGYTGEYPEPQQGKDEEKEPGGNGAGDGSGPINACDPETDADCTGDGPGTGDGDGNGPNEDPGNGGNGGGNGNN